MTHKRRITLIAQIEADASHVADAVFREAAKKLASALTAAEIKGEHDLTGAYSLVWFVEPKAVRVRTKKA